MDSVSDPEGQMASPVNAAISSSNKALTARELGREFGKIRSQRGLERSDLSVIAGVPLPTIRKLENGWTHVSLTMAEFFRLVLAVHVIPSVVTDASWDDNTRYRRIFREGGRIELQPVRPLRARR